MKELRSVFQAFRPHQLSLAAARAARHAEYLRSLHQASAVDPAKERALQDDIRRDLVDPAHTELVPRMWHELDGEEAAEFLRERIELCTEVFQLGTHQLVPILVTFVVKVTCMREINYFVPLDDRAGRLPECRAIAKAAGASAVVLDPHVYHPRALELVTARAVRDRSIHLLKFPFGSGRLPAPLAQPLLVQAGPEPEWCSAVKAGVAVYQGGAPTLIRDVAHQREMRRTRYVCEIAFPLSLEKAIAAKSVAAIKCHGVYAWHAGLRAAREAEILHRLGQQAFLGDSARFLLAKNS